MDEELCGTQITGTYLAECLKKSLGSKAILRSVEGEKIAVGQGFVSHIVKVRLTWDTDDHLPKTLIVKIPTDETINRSLEEIDAADTKDHVKSTIAVFHDTECDLYDIFGGQPPIPVPKCYAVYRGSPQAPAMIVLEDLSEKGSIIPCLVAGLNLPQILEATAALAKLHGWSLTTTVDWRSRVGDVASREALYRPFLAGVQRGYVAVKEKFPRAFGKMNVDKVVEYVKFEKILEFANMHRQFMDDVLTHGDSWANNILYEKRSDGTVGDRLVALIDFQMAMRGCPMSDMARLMTWSVTQEIRRNHIKEILRHYYDTLKSIAGDKFTATYEQMEDLYHKQFAYSALHVISGLPMLVKAMVKSEGEQRVLDEITFIARMKAAYKDAMITLGESY